MITLIGTGHVFDLSSQLLTLLEKKEPGIICIELDKQRYNSLLIRHTHQKTHRDFEKKLPLIYKLLAKFQENIAKEYGVNAGDEMLTAIKYAQTHQIPLKLIDMNAQHLFTKMWHHMPLSEKIRLLLTGVTGIFISRERIEKELKHLQENFDKYIEEINKKFPTIKKTLIDERNKYMTDQLIYLNKDYNNIVACIGDGHIPGISKMLKSKKIEFEAIRLNELRKIREETDTTHAHFTMEYKNNTS
ncbi:MAG: hypothetical protein DRN08_02155 [Thermoplasmata archaeon]|nr:MAG: hypothetical protein DRN05_03060 [Thermoplasmata archaeon]RLF35979.1 MAG: hypothetical protein DRN08_02155 [Thermoplasmata archaeon]